MTENNEIGTEPSTEDNTGNPCGDTPNPERRVRVSVKGKSYTFKTNRIERLEETEDPDVTFIRMIAVNTVKTAQQGFYNPTIKVYLPHDELDRKIYHSSCDLVDLTAFCKRPAPLAGGIKVGSKTDAFSVCAGISPDTQKPLHIAKADTRNMTLWGAKFRARRLRKKTGLNWRLPSKGEALVIFNRSSLLPGFEAGKHTRLNDSHYRLSDGRVMQATGLHRLSTAKKIVKYPVRLVHD